MPSLEPKPKDACRYDIVSLGEIMLRLDPGEGRIRTARHFRAWEGGGEYNVARGLRRCFGLRAAVVTALVRNEVGRLARELVRAGAANPRTGFAALDLESLHQKLLPAVRSLAQKLGRSDKRAVEKLPRIDGELERVDLGQVLSTLADSGKPEVRRAAQEVERALAETILEKVNPAAHPLDSGLSVSPRFWSTLA